MDGKIREITILLCCTGIVKCLIVFNQEITFTERHHAFITPAIKKVIFSLFVIWFSDFVF